MSAQEYLILDASNSHTGDLLDPKDQEWVKAVFTNRYTGDHNPTWVTVEPLQFSDDDEWLRFTRFRTKPSGALDRCYSYCWSTPTWPLDPDLRKGRYCENVGKPFVPTYEVLTPYTKDGKPTNDYPIGRTRPDGAHDIIAVAHSRDDAYRIAGALK